MLSPSKLFFGAAEWEPSLDEKPIWADGDGKDIWQDSDDADERTDVPVDAHEKSAEHSLEASLNDSEEERRSPLSPGAGSAAAYPMQMAAAVSGGQQQRVAPSCAPPGLPLVATSGPPPPGLLIGDDMPSPMPISIMKPVLERNDADNSDEDGADDEADDSDDALQRGLLDASGAIRYSELPSIGSANHFSGNCDRCCFHPKGRCLNGFNCQHCHFDHEKRKRKNKKKNKSKLHSLDDGMDGSSMADGSSMPVSPEAHFGSSMLLPQVDFSVSASTSPQHGNSGFLTQQPSHFTGTDAAARPPSAGGLGENKWFQTATGMPQQSAPPSALPPPLQDTSSFATAPPPGYDFSCQLPCGPGQTLLGPQAENGYASRLEMESRFAGEQQDRREEYIRQLEAENRYLRTCLIQYLGPNAAALSLLPPLPCVPPQPSAFFRQPDGLVPTEVGDSTLGQPLQFGLPPPPGVPAPMPPGASLIPGSSNLPPMTIASQGLSPSAPPFWPACLEQGSAVPLRQDADGPL